MFKKILIANRGEIALRLQRTFNEMGIETVLVHSTADANSKPVRLAEHSICIGPPAAKNSYLNIPAILSAAHITGVDAIHPGIGFLSENANFAEKCEEMGISFIGPSPEHISLMGDKIQAKITAEKLGLPTIPGFKGDISSVAMAKKIANEIGYPIILKAASGGGGRGMKTAQNDNELEQNFEICRNEALSAFGDDRVYMEKYLQKPRHIEIQILGDGNGRAWHFYERDCSVQRRHQKIVEECPSPALNAELRQKICQTSVQAMEKMGYKGVGTLEFLYENGEFYFIEMNTRLQVEHTITEMITGFNLVELQLRVAAGEKLKLEQSHIKIKGHAIECRINAESPVNFQPSPGLIKLFHTPGGYGVRVDSHVYSGYAIPPFYDSLIAKLVVHADTRNIAISRSLRALKEFVIDGVQTLIPLHKEILTHPQFISGVYDNHWLEQYLASKGL